MDISKGYICENARERFRTQESCMVSQEKKQTRTEARAKWIKGKSICMPKR